MPEEDLQKKYQSLPEELKKALFDEEIASKIYELGERFNVPKEKMKTLVQITGKVFLKIIDIDHLKEVLKDQLHISLINAMGLYQELKKEVFSPYEKYLKEKNQESSPETINKESFEQKQQTDEQREEKIIMRKALLNKKGPDKYREPIDEEEEEQTIRTPQVIVKNSNGRIKKVL